jgi:uncharacterized membrane-anchored protein YitT (DUF2179 family)
MGTELRRKISKSKVLAEIKNILFVILGCSILAFADAAFLTPGNIISGGVVSVGIIASTTTPKDRLGFSASPSINDVVVTIVQVILWIIGWFTLGKKFSLNTLVASISYPLIYALAFPFQRGWGFGPLRFGRERDGRRTDAGWHFRRRIGGRRRGCFLSGQWLDRRLRYHQFHHREIQRDEAGCLGFHHRRFAHCHRHDLHAGSDPRPHRHLGRSSCAVAVQYIYVNADTFVIVDILSDHYEEIQDYIHKDMDHATTVIDTIGGYTGEKRKMIRVVIYQVETAELRSKIAEIDPKAFVSFTQAKTINGEGFEPFIVPRKPTLHRSHRENHELQYDAERMAEEAKANAKKQKALQKPAQVIPKAPEKAVVKAEVKPDVKATEKVETKPVEKPVAKTEGASEKAPKDEKGDK